MSCLSDRGIEDALRSGGLIIRPLGENSIQPASVDIRLSDQVMMFRDVGRDHIDVREDNVDLMELTTISEDSPFMLRPGDFVLASTLEWINIPADLVARLDGKSSLGRMGLLIHSTAGFIDPGFSGTITLELSNVSNLPVTLYPRMKIGQLSFQRLECPAERPYGSAGLGSKYQGQVEPTASRAHLEFSQEEPHGG